VIDGCITQYREKKTENLPTIRDFWESMRKIYDSNATWNNDFWNNMADGLARMFVNDFKSTQINCTKMLKNLKQVDNAKVTEVLGRAEYFGAFNSAVPADKAHYISSMFGSRRKMAQQGAFKLMNDRSRGKAL
jgi:hypothetical protein